MPKGIYNHKKHTKEWKERASGIMKDIWKNNRNERLNSLQRGEKHWEWKGENVSYIGLHLWVRRNLGKPIECKHCGKIWDKPRSIHWANKSGEYKRNLTDWISLCVKCHSSYDRRED